MYVLQRSDTTATTWSTLPKRLVTGIRRFHRRYHDWTYLLEETEKNNKTEVKSKKIKQTF